MAARPARGIWNSLTGLREWLTPGGEMVSRDWNLIPIVGALVAALAVPTMTAVQQRAAKSTTMKPAMRKVSETARPLPLDAVRLTGGPLKRAQDLDAQYLLALEPD